MGSPAPLRHDPASKKKKKELPFFNIKRTRACGPSLLVATMDLPTEGIFCRTHPPYSGIAIATETALVPGMQNIGSTAHGNHSPSFLGVLLLLLNNSLQAGCRRFIRPRAGTTCGTSSGGLVGQILDSKWSWGALCGLRLISIRQEPAIN